jgi:hypothetical protein
MNIEDNLIMAKNGDTGIVIFLCPVCGCLHTIDICIRDIYKEYRKIGNKHIVFDICYHDNKPYFFHSVVSKNGRNRCHYWIASGHNRTGCVYFCQDSEFSGMPYCGDYTLKSIKDWGLLGSVAESVIKGKHFETVETYSV